MGPRLFKSSYRLAPTGQLARFVVGQPAPRLGGGRYSLSGGVSLRTSGGRGNNSNSSIASVWAHYLAIVKILGVHLGSVVNKLPPLLPPGQTGWGGGAGHHPVVSCFAVCLSVSLSLSLSLSLSGLYQVMS